MDRFLTEKRPERAWGHRLQGLYSCGESVIGCSAAPPSRGRRLCPVRPGGTGWWRSCRLWAWVTSCCCCSASFPPWPTSTTRRSWKRETSSQRASSFRTANCEETLNRRNAVCVLWCVCCGCSHLAACCLQVCVWCGVQRSDSGAQQRGERTHHPLWPPPRTQRLLTGPGAGHWWGLMGDAATAAVLTSRDADLPVCRDSILIFRVTIQLKQVLIQKQFLIQKLFFYFRNQLFHSRNSV